MCVHKQDTCLHFRQGDSLSGPRDYNECASTSLAHEAPSARTACPTPGLTYLLMSSYVMGQPSLCDIQSVRLQGFNIKGMSKGQKRRHFDRFGVATEKPRGHDWVDLVSHLAKR